MKHLWMIVSTLALANLLSIGGLAAWLHQSGRLNSERVESVRKIFSITLAQEQAAITDEQAKAEADKAQAVAAAKTVIPPETAAERIAERQLQAEKQLQTVLRKQQELENLRGFVLKQLADLERREAELTHRRTAFDLERRRIAETEGAAQFKAALATLETQKPKDAKAVLKALLDTNQSDQVVSYLARMDESKRGKVLAEFVKDEPAVAADLLERIRTRGTPLLSAASAGKTAPDDPLARAN